MAQKSTGLLRSCSGAELKRMSLICPLCGLLSPIHHYYDHLNGCSQKSSPRPLAKCPYNRRHRMEAGQVELHMQKCPNRPFATGDSEVPPAPPVEEMKKLASGGNLKVKKWPTDPKPIWVRKAKVSGD